MLLYLFLLMLTVNVSTGFQVSHMDMQYTGCSDTQSDFIYSTDNEELYYSDFSRHEGVVTAPDFADPITFPGFYELGVILIDHCRLNLASTAKAHSQPEEQTARPETCIYSKDDVVLGVENVLICHVTGFFPPSVTIIWTKNNMNVSENINQSQYRLKSDGTFNIFSTLRFTPEEKDMYSCTVYHKALEEKSETRTWEVDLAVPSVGPAVFCGVGLTLGLLGVAIGVFFLLKGHI